MSLLKQKKYTDDEIVQFIKNWDKDFFSVIIDRYSQKLSNYIFNMVCNDKNFTQECLQETFLKVREKINFYKIWTNFNAWIYRIAHNTTINYIKKNTKSWLFFQIDKKEIVLEENKLESIDKNFRKQILQEVLSEIDEINRSVLLLYYYEYKSYEEISKILDIPKNTVWTLISRAKIKIKKIFKQKWFDEFYLN